MLKKNITYTNFDGQQVTKSFYFNITKAELALAELESDGTWSQSLQIISESKKGSIVFPEFKKILKWTYGERVGEDGFDKSDAAYARFENTEAWSTLIMELLGDAGAAANFVNAVLPADIAAKNLEAQKINGFRPGASTERPMPPVAGQQDTPVVVEQPAQVPTETPEEMEARIRAEILASAPERQTGAHAALPSVPPAVEQEQGIQHISEPRSPEIGQQ